MSLFWFRSRRTDCDRSLFGRDAAHASGVTWLVCLAVHCGKHPYETCHLPRACYYHFPCHASERCTDWWLFQMGRCATCSWPQAAYTPPFDIPPSAFPSLVYSVIPPPSPSYIPPVSQDGALFESGTGWGSQWEEKPPHLPELNISCLVWSHCDVSSGENQDYS